MANSVAEEQKQAQERATRLKGAEDRIRELIDKSPQLDRLIMYKVLYGEGVRVATLEQDIRRALREGK